MKSTTKPLVNRIGLAADLGVSPRTIGKWVQEGMPCARPGRPGVGSLFDVEACRAWLRDRQAARAARGGALEEARARREHWQALLAEQTYRTRERDLLPADEAEAAWGRERLRIRRIVEAAYSDPQAIAAVFEAVTRDGGAEAALKELAYRVLRELAGPDPKELNA